MQWIFIAGSKHNVIATKIQIDSDEKEREIKWYYTGQMIQILVMRMVIFSLTNRSCSGNVGIYLSIYATLRAVTFNQG